MHSEKMSKEYAGKDNSSISMQKIISQHPKIVEKTKDRFVETHAGWSCVIFFPRPISKCQLFMLYLTQR